MYEYVLFVVIQLWLGIFIKIRFVLVVVTMSLQLALTDVMGYRSTTTYYTVTHLSRLPLLLDTWMEHGTWNHPEEVIAIADR